MPGTLESKRLASYRWKERNPERSRAIGKAHAERRREMLRNIKLDKGCMDCGYNERAEALDFDHRPEETKLLSLAGDGQRRRWDLVLAEIEKCDVVCANCHRVRTADRRAS